MNFDVNDAAISSLSHLVGNDHVKRSIQVVLDYAQTEGTAFPNTILLGSPGVGKSSYSAVIAKEMAADYTEVIGQSLVSVADVNHLLLSASEKAVVAIDEAHELPAPLQTSLYLALDKRTVFVNVGGQAPQPIRLANFTLILATSEEYSLLPPLRDRAQLSPSAQLSVRVGTGQGHPSPEPRFGVGRSRSRPASDRSTRKVCLGSH